MPTEHLTTSSPALRRDSWRIYRTWGGRKTFLGVVTAVDKVAALQVAMRQFNITDPEHQKRIEAELRDL